MAKVDKVMIEVPVATIAAAIVEKLTEDGSIVEVVRCKDCKHRDKYECNYISLGGTKCGVTDDWFCADGERRGDGRFD